MDRRTLLRTAGLVPLGLLLPGLGCAAVPRDARRLLLIELNGGNDSLAMVVPHADPKLQAMRARLLTEPDKLVKLDERVALHPGLAPLLPAFQDKQLAVAMGLGYADSSRSHFKSIEVWDAGDERAGTDGWLTRLPAPKVGEGGYAAAGIVIGRNPGPVTGGDGDPIVITTAQSFIGSAKNVQAIEAQSGNAALQKLLRLQGEIESAAGGLAASRSAPPGKFPTFPLGKDMAEAARLLINEPAAPIVKVALSGFDTHVQQKPAHDRLMSQLGESLAAFRSSMIEAGAWQHTLVMTYSEFGRRAKANGNNGSDHGTAASHLIMGGAIKGGLYGEVPSLAGLQGDDLRVTTDFRCLYNAVLADWFGQPTAQIDAQQHRKLALI